MPYRNTFFPLNFPTMGENNEGGFVFGYETVTSLFEFSGDWIIIGGGRFFKSYPRFNLIFKTLIGSAASGYFPSV